jgi:hypothetical protein
VKIGGYFKGVKGNFPKILKLRFHGRFLRVFASVWYSLPILIVTFIYLF